MIIRTRFGGDVDVRAREFPAPFIGRSGGLGAGVHVTHENAISIPSYSRAVRICAQGIACSEILVERETPDGECREVTTTWQARLFARPRYNPVQDRYQFWYTVEESRSYRNVAYVWKDIVGGQVAQLWALHPDQVLPVFRGRELRFIVGVGPGYPNPTSAAHGTVEVDGSTVLQIRDGGLGALVPATPIEQFRLTLGAGIARTEYEAALWESGAGGMLAVSFPEGVDHDQAAAWQDSWEAKFSGPRGAAKKTRVIGDGAKITPISFTPQDAQFIESGQLGLEDAARIIGVPVSVLDGRQGAAPLSPEHESMRLNQYGLVPRRESLEAAFAADPDLFGERSRDHLEIRADRVKGDAATEDMISHQQVQDGRITVNEWRADHGKPPVPGGDIPQFIPVGGGGTLPPGMQNDSGGGVGGG